MYWEEKIDLIKKRFTSAEFKDPFTQGLGIFEKIVRTFHDATPLTFRAALTKEHLIKEKTLIKECSLQALFDHELIRLNNTENYWALLVTVPMGSPNRVYDCRRPAIEQLVSLILAKDNTEFYIVDKKYRWLTYFKVDSSHTTVAIYKSGATETPFG